MSPKPEDDATLLEEPGAVAEPTPEAKTKAWAAAHVWGPAWGENSNSGRAKTCVQFLHAHGFLSDEHAAELHAEVVARSAEG